MTATERPSDAAMALAVREQQERGYYTGACDCIIARAREIDESRMNTHAADCYLWGVKHHECAVREIERLRAIDAAPADPINPPETDSKLIVPSGACWRRAFDELIERELCVEHPIFDSEWASIEQRAIELAREGK